MLQTHQRSLPWVGQVSRRPAGPVAVMLALGIFAHELLPHWPIAWMILLAGLIGAAVWWHRRRMMACNAALLAGCALAGLSLAQFEAFFYPSDHISAFASDQPRLAQIELYLDYPPRLLSWPAGQSRAMPPKQVVTASVLRIKAWSGWITCSGQILVQIAQPHPRLEQGQTVRVIGMLGRPMPAMNPGQFDWADYYREQRILASVQVSEAGNVVILRQNWIGPLGWLRERSRQALANGFPADRSLDHALLRALVLGDNDPELRDVQEQFRRTGTSHHLAISGMHIAVLGGVVFGVCRLLRIMPRAACWVSLLFVVLYGAVALPSPPVMRSVLLCVCFGAGILQRRSTDAIQLLALSVLGMLVYHPLDLYNAGFQLSFGTVLGLMLFTGPLISAIPGGDRDVEIAQLARRTGFLGTVGQKFKRLIRATLAASIVAWVVSMPLIALHFEQINPWAVVGSIVLAPVVFAALVGGFAKVLLTLLWPSFSPAWAAAAALPIAAMRHTVDWLAGFPGADVPLPSPPVWSIVLFYAMLLSLLIPWHSRTRRWTARGTVLIGCSALAMFFVCGRFAPGAGELRVTLLSVGAGQCAVVEPPGAGAVVIDAGSATFSDLFNKALAPFLRHQGRRNIRCVFISHANYDHFSAVAELVSAYDVGAVYISPHFRAQCEQNPPARLLLQSLDALKRAPVELPGGREIDIGGGARITVLWPPVHCESDPNNSSQVLRLSYAGRSMLFTGDLQGAGERDLRRSIQDLRADVLVAPHHGSYENTTLAFVDAVAPAFIVCSDDPTPSARQRAFDRALRDRTVFHTRLGGAIGIRMTRDGQIFVQSRLAVRR